MKNETIEIKSNKGKIIIVIVITLVVIVALVLSIIFKNLPHKIEDMDRYEVEVVRKGDLVQYANTWLTYYFEQCKTTEKEDNKQIKSFKIDKIKKISETSRIVRVVMEIVPKTVTDSYWETIGKVNNDKLDCDMLLKFNINSIDNGKIKVGLDTIEETTESKLSEYMKLGTTVKTNINRARNPVVPEGFKKVDTDIAKWNVEKGIVTDYDKGLVIEDEKGNQFVWVPVDREISTYAITELEEDTWNDELPTGIKNESDQIKKYGGFYIARYEAGVPEDMQGNNTNISNMTNNKLGIPVSKKGVRPWDCIEYKKAKQNAESMYNTDKLKSGLVTYDQYNTILNWLENTQNNGNSYNLSSNTFTGLYSKDNGKNYEYAENLEINDINFDKGNVNRNIIFSCGILQTRETNNIYDLFSNLYELITRYGKGYCDIVGGTYNDIYLSKKLKYTSPQYNIGFRVVLYMI